MVAEPPATSPGVWRRIPWEAPGKVPLPGWVPAAAATVSVPVGERVAVPVAARPAMVQGAMVQAAVVQGAVVPPGPLVPRVVPQGEAWVLDSLRP